MHAALHYADMFVNNFFCGLQSIYVVFSNCHFRWNKIRDTSTLQIIHLQKEVDNDQLGVLEIDEVVKHMQSTSSVCYIVHGEVVRFMSFNAQASS